jgi:hypothetical protein
LEWKENPEKTQSKIIISKNDVNIASETDWNNQHEWFKANIEKFDRVFRRRVKNLSVGNSNN